MKPIDIMSEFVTNEKFNDLFIQLFVETNGTFNYAFFMKHFDIQSTYSEINSAIKELTGTKLIKFTEPEKPVPSYVWDNFINSHYLFGEYVNARTWILDVYERYGVVIPRKNILTWIASQHPPKAQSSFLPSNDRNLYVAKEAS